MAKPKTTLLLTIQLSNEDSPETFSKPCALRTRGIQFQTDTNEEEVLDCADPNLPVWKDVYATSKGATISGAGKLAMADLADWWAWYNSGTTKNIRVDIGETLANGGGYWAMAAMLTSMEISQEFGGTAELQVEIRASGAVAWTDAAA